MRKRIALKAETTPGEVRTTVKMPEMMLAEVDEAMGKVGESRRYRSQWISAAIKDFLHRDDMIDVLAEEFIRRGTCKTVGLTMPRLLSEEIDGQLERMAHTGELKSDRSSIVRAAVTGRLINTESDWT